MKAGAVNFLPKPFRDQDMLDAVCAAIDRDRQRRTAEDDTGEIRARFATLSPREQQVMMLVTAGKLNKQVAGDLGLSEVTVKIHRGAAMREPNHTARATAWNKMVIFRYHPDQRRTIVSPPRRLFRSPG
jgi:FixJ family two-component response regulator